MFKQFRKDDSGNMAVILAVCLTMIMAGVGVAVDFAGIESKKTSYQSMADAAVLAAARTGSSDHAELLQVAQDVVARHNLSGENLTTRLTFSADDKIQVHVEGVYQTMIMGMFGKSESDIKTKSESILGVNGYVNLVLVLDGTGSMGRNSRLANMKAAATHMVSEFDTFDNDKLQISVVPFAEYVNVGVPNRNEPWVDVPPDWIETLPERCTRPVIDRVNCRMGSYPATGPTAPGTCTSDGVTYSCGGSPGRPGGTRQVCDNVYGPEVCTNPTRLHTWHGIVGSRRHPHNKSNDVHSGNRVPGFLDVTGNVPILPLTNNLAQVKSKINSVISRGDTYMPSGLIWGWRVLDVDAPFTEAAASPQDKVRNIMVFMTDGENTRSINGNEHTGIDRNAADNVTEELCTRIKDDNIELYSISYEVIDASARNLVRNCASDNTMYYDAASGAQLSKAFKDISQSILTPRITQ